MTHPTPVEIRHQETTFDLILFSILALCVIVFVVLVGIF
ncbi:hypothetical protein Pse7367_0247 [Thalassoporum mexicanum PCC 7367]|nr:hypothetical protein Pse7367_0247 [Pseudanabaena sp. PCC 7367]